MSSQAEAGRVEPHHVAVLISKMNEVIDAYGGVRREMTGILDAAVEASLDNCRRAFERLVTDAERRITAQIGRVEGEMGRRLEEAKALIAQLGKARVTLDGQSVAELMTHARPMLYRAVAEAREHLAAYIVDDIRNGIGAAVGAEVRQALVTQPAKRSWTEALARLCSIAGFIILAVGAAAVWYATKNFKPPVVDLKFDRDGRVLPLHGAPEAFRGHALAMN